MSKINIGITGSTGSLGKEMLKYNKELNFIRYQGDIRSKIRLKKWFEKNNFDAIFHLAAIVPIKVVNKNRRKALEVNLNGTKNIVDEAIKNNIGWFFFSSTSHVYSSSNKRISEKFKLKPISYYGKTKKLAEDYIIKKFKKKNINYCIGRIFSTTNKSQKENYLIPDLKKRIKNNNKKILLKNLNHYRDFISLEDLSKIIIILHKKKFKGIINLGSGNSIHLKKIASIIAKKYKKTIKFEDNKIPTFLVANVSKLKKFCRHRLSKKIETQIF